MVKLNKPSHTQQTSLLQSSHRLTEFSQICCISVIIRITDNYKLHFVQTYYRGCLLTQSLTVFTHHVIHDNYYQAVAIHSAKSTVPA